MAGEQGSKPLALNTTDLKKTATGLGLALLGAVLAYASTEFVPLLEDSTDQTKLFLAAVLSAAVNFGRKWLTDNTKKE